MAKKAYGRVRWVDDYNEAPESAEYILRPTGAFYTTEWRFEKYDGYCDYKLLKVFPSDAMIGDNRVATLISCRELANCNKTIYVERPTTDLPILVDLS